MEARKHLLSVSQWAALQCFLQIETRLPRFWLLYTFPRLRPTLYTARCRSSRSCTSWRSMKPDPLLGWACTTSKPYQHPSWRSAFDIADAPTCKHTRPVTRREHCHAHYTKTAFLPRANWSPCPADLAPRGNGSDLGYDPTRTCCLFCYSIPVPLHLGN